MLDLRLILISLIWTIVCLLAVAVIGVLPLTSARSSPTQSGTTQAEAAAATPETVAPKAPSKVVTVAVDSILTAFDKDGSCGILDSDAVKIMQEMTQVARVVLIAKVKSDEEEAAIRSILESAKVVGDDSIPKHRLLFCGTSLGRAAMVRQLSPVLHFESDAPAATAMETRGIPFVFVNMTEEDSVPCEQTPVDPEKLFRSACGDLSACLNLMKAYIS